LQTTNYSDPKCETKERKYRQKEKHTHAKTKERKIHTEREKKPLTHAKTKERKIHTNVKQKKKNTHR
jgi:hypothetical protein